MALTNRSPGVVVVDAAVAVAAVVDAGDAAADRDGGAVRGFLSGGTRLGGTPWASGWNGQR